MYTDSVAWMRAQTQNLQSLVCDYSNSVEKEVLKLWKNLPWSEHRTKRNKVPLFLLDQNIKVFRKLCTLQKKKCVMKLLILILYYRKTLKTLVWATMDSFKTLSYVWKSKIALWNSHSSFQRNKHTHYSLFPNNLIYYL